MNFLLRLYTKSDDLCIIGSETLAVLFRSFSDANPCGCSTDCAKEERNECYYKASGHKKQPLFQKKSD